MRIKRAVNAVKKRRKIFKLSKGYFGSKSRSYRIARQAVMKSHQKARFPFVVDYSYQRRGAHQRAVIFQVYARAQSVRH